MPGEAISGERELSGPEKAAALLLMMGKPPAARLLKQFDQPDLRAVALAAAGLGAIPAAMLDQPGRRICDRLFRRRRPLGRRGPGQKPPWRRPPA